MEPSRSLLRVLLVALCLGGPFSTVRAAITPTGDVEPDPSTWTANTAGYVGNTADGTLTVDSGSVVTWSYGFIAYNSGVTGVATVTGVGSSWIGNEGINVGLYGNGTLNITGGATVSSSFAGMGFWGARRAR